MKSTSIIFAALGCLILPAQARPVLAQQSTIPMDVQAIFTDIDDIDKLRILNPLKLTSEQLGKLVKIMKDSQADYNKKIADTLVPKIRATASEVKETRRQMLGGQPIPGAFDTKVKKMQSDYVAQRKTIDEATVRSLAAQIREVFTDEQHKIAIATAQTLTTRDGKKAQGSDEQFFNLYVTGTFIAYGKIVPLLEDMKSARSGEAPMSASSHSARKVASSPRSSANHARRSDTLKNDGKSAANSRS